MPPEPTVSDVRRAAMLENVDEYLEVISAGFAGVARRAAVAHWFDEQILADLLRRGGRIRVRLTQSSRRRHAQKFCREVRDAPFVEPYPGRGYTFHSLTRDVLLDQLWSERRETYREVSRNAVEYFSRTIGKSAAIDDWRELAYHLMVVDEDQGTALLSALVDAVEGTVLAGQADSLVAVAEEHCAAGRLSADAAVAVRLLAAEAANAAERFGEARDIASGILAMDGVDPPIALSALHTIAEGHLAMNEYAEAVAALEDARRYEPSLPPEVTLANLLGLAKANMAWGRLNDARDYLLLALDRAVSSKVQRGADDSMPTSEQWRSASNWSIDEDGHFVIVGRPENSDGSNGATTATSPTWRVEVGNSLLADIWFQLADYYDTIGDYGRARSSANVAGAIAEHGGDSDTAVAAAELIYRIAKSIGDQEEMRRMVAVQETVADRAAGQGRLEMTARLQLGQVQIDIYDYDAAAQSFARATEIAREIGDTAAQAEAIRSSASVEWIRGNDNRAGELLQEALAVVQSRAVYPGAEAALLVYMATYYRNHNDRSTGRASAERALAIYRDIDDRVGELDARLELATLATVELKYEEALSLYRERVKVAETMDSPRLLADCLADLAWMLNRMRRYDEADDVLARAVELTKESGNPSVAAQLLVVAGDAFSRRREYESAVDCLVEADELYGVIENLDGRYGVLLALSRAYGGWGKHAEAITAADEAVSIAERTKDPDVILDAVIQRGLTYLRADQPDVAKESLQRAAEMRPDSVDVLGAMSWLHVKSGDPSIALDYADRALERDATATWVISNRALALLALGQSAEALDSYRRAIEVSPPDDDLVDDLNALEAFVQHHPHAVGADDALQLLRSHVRGG